MSVIVFHSLYYCNDLHKHKVFYVRIIIAHLHWSHKKINITFSLIYPCDKRNYVFIYIFFLLSQTILHTWMLRLAARIGQATSKINKNEHRNQTHANRLRLLFHCRVAFYVRAQMKKTLPFPSVHNSMIFFSLSTFEHRWWFS